MKIVMYKNRHGGKIFFRDFHFCRFSRADPIQIQIDSQHTIISVMILLRENPIQIQTDSQHTLISVMIFRDHDSKLETPLHLLIAVQKAI